MKLYTVSPNPYSYRNYTPEEGIELGIVKKVPCLDPKSYAWEYHALESEGIDPDFHILPVILTESEKLKIKDRVTQRTKSKFKNQRIHSATLHRNSNSVFFLKQQDTNIIEKIEDKNVLVSLELPLSAAQPYYEFAGDIEIILGIYANYYGKNFLIEKENILCSGIVKMTEGSSMTVHYTNRLGEGEAITWMMDEVFKFICHDGKLTRLDDHNFSQLYSDFELD